MYKKDFLEQKYCEINQLKNLLQTYPKEYCETIIKVMEKVFDEISEYLNKESNKIKEVTKIDSIESKVNGLDKKIGDLGNKIIGNENININQNKCKKEEKDKEDKQCKKYKEKSKQKHNKLDKKRQDDNREYELKRYTMEEISKFDGKDGTLAYVVINGRVYDVTSIKQWFNGKHYGLTAGKDLTEYFNSCHKSEKNILKKLKIVGKVENG